MNDRDTLSHAREYLARGWAIFTVPAGSKRPVERGWTSKRLTLEEIEGLVRRGPVNLCIHLGQPSGNLVRVDLDCEEAVRAAQVMMPRTGVVLGRLGNPSSGLFYVVSDELPSSLTYKDPTGTGDEATLIDVLWTGKMTVAPPSTHPDGSTYTWEAFEQPSRLTAAELMLATDFTSAVALLARYWPDGARHDAAMALCGALISSDVAYEDAERILRGVLHAARDDEVEDRLKVLYDTAESFEAGRNVVGWTRLQEMMDPRAVRRVRDKLGLNQRAQVQRTVNASELGMTDTGNGSRMVAYFGDRIRYNHATHQWHVWDGTRWKVDTTARAFRYAVETTKKMYAEAATLDSKDKRQALSEWAVESERYSHLVAMMKIAATEDTVVVEPDHLDVDIWLLNTPLGTVDLRTGKIADHNPGDLISMSTRGAPTPGATCPQWMQFIDEVFQHDAEMIAFIQRLFGYTLIGTTREQKIGLCWGDGQNGKSTLLRTVVHVLGDYGAWAPFDTFDATAKNGPGNDLARLKGKRLVIAVESDNERVLSEARIKLITGGDRVTCRFLYGEFFEYEPQFTVLLATNHKPIIRGTDHGIWRRMLFMEFAKQFLGDADNKELREALEAECDGILVWLLGGVRAYLAEGLNPPERVVRATAEYRSEMDVTAQFLSECTIQDDAAEVLTKDLYLRYSFWAQEYGEKKLTHRSFSLELGRRGYTKVKSNSQIRWRGLRLRPEVFRTAGMDAVG